MADGIEIEGFEEFEEMLQEMTITPEDEKKAMREAIKPVAEEIEKNTPKRTGKLSKLSKTVKKDGFATVGIVRTKMFYDRFAEFGTSFQKKNLGYFSNSVDSKQNDVLEILKKNLLDK